MTGTLPPIQSLTLAVALAAFGADAHAAVIPWGYGAIAKGGAGGDVYFVTNLNDSGPGSLRQGITIRNGPRVVVISVGGTVKLKSEIRIELPYLTVDGSLAPGPTGFTVEQASITTRALRIVATHDIIIHGIRSAGLWVPKAPGGGNVNDAATLSVDGDGAPSSPNWDPHPDACGPDLADRRNACRIIIDRVTLSGAADDGPDFWCGVKDLTISRSLIIDNYHPRGTGCDDVYGESDSKSRQRITEYANVYAYNGERQPKLLEGIYDFDLVNNIVFAWQDYKSAYGLGVGGYGSVWEDDGAEDRHNVIANVWMPDTGGVQKRACRQGTNKCRQGWDCVWGVTTQDDHEVLLKADGLHYADNVFGPWHNPKECVSTASGQQPFFRPYTLPIHSTKSSASMELVLDDAGVQLRTARELQVVANVRAALRARLRP